MPQGILKFNLPDEERDFKFAQQGVDWFCAMHDFEQWLFYQVDECDKQPSSKEILDKFYECMNSYNLSTHD